MSHWISHHLSLAVRTHYNCLKTTGRVNESKHSAHNAMAYSMCKRRSLRYLSVSALRSIYLHCFYKDQKKKKDMRKANGTWRGNMSFLNEIKSRLTFPCLYGNREREKNLIDIDSYYMLLEGYESSSTMLYINIYLLYQIYQACSQIKKRD